MLESEYTPDQEVEWAVKRARVLKAAEDVDRVAHGEGGQRCKTLPSALGELRDALRSLREGV